MLGLRAALCWVVISTVPALWPVIAAAQGNFEIQVYGAETVDPGRTMIELHSNVAAKGTRHTVDGETPARIPTSARVTVWFSWRVRRFPLADFAAE